MGFWKDYRDFREQRARQRRDDEYYRDRPYAKMLSETTTFTNVHVHVDPTKMLVSPSGPNVRVHVDGNTVVFIGRLDWPEIRDRIQNAVTTGYDERERIDY